MKVAGDDDAVVVVDVVDAVVDVVAVDVDADQDDVDDQS